jgi:hypothetical protein
LTKSFFGKNTHNRLWAQIVKRGTEGIHQIVNNMFHGMPATADRTGTKIGCWTQNPMVLPGRTRQADTNRIVRKAGPEMTFFSCTLQPIIITFQSYLGVKVSSVINKA